MRKVRKPQLIFHDNPHNRTDGFGVARFSREFIRGEKLRIIVTVRTVHKKVRFDASAKQVVLRVRLEGATDTRESDPGRVASFVERCAVKKRRRKFASCRKTGQTDNNKLFAIAY